MPNPENIIPPVHGEIRNPKGRGKGVRNRATIYREVLELAAKANGITLDTLPPDADMATAIAYSIAMKAYHDGDVPAAREAFDSAFGKNADVLIEQSGPRKMVMVVTQSDIDDPPTE
jgi:ATP/maltotriose-dependent transcriptional regulator MalT